MAQDLERSSELVVDLAKEFMALLKRSAPAWQKGYWRFDSEEERYGSNASYVTSNGVFLIGAVREGRFYETMNTLGRKLWEAEPEVSKRFRLCLLIVDSTFDYELKFERSDSAKWRITKLDGASGIPAGL